MQLPTTVHLYGSLQCDREQAAGTPVQTDLDAPLPLLAVLDRLGIEPHRVRLAMVNHRSVSGTAVIRPGDRVALFPREYPIFADWRGYRFQ